MKKCYNIKTWEDITVRTTIGAKEDCIFIVHKDGSVDDFVTDSGDYVEKKLSTFEMLERMIDHDDACRNLAIKQSTPTDPVLAKLCELAGAKMYDDYVILSCFFGIGETLADEIVYTQGNIYKILMQQDRPIEQRNRVDYIDGKITDTPSTVMIGFYNGNHELIGDGGGYYIDIRQGSISIICYLNNAFEEYSKHLRNEENKFEEIKKLLNL